MTIGTTTRKNYYEADGVVTVFPYTFKIVEADQLRVYFENAAGSLFQQTTGFSISGVGEPSGGNVTFDTAPGGSVTHVLLIRQTALTQGVDLVPGGKFGANTLEGALDKLTCALQEQEEELSRALTTRTQDGSVGATVPSEQEGSALYWAGGILLNTPFNILALAAATGATMPTPEEGKVLAWSGGVLVNIPAPTTPEIQPSAGSDLYCFTTYPSFGF